jgi:hypothetical protein
LPTLTDRLFVQAIIGRSEVKTAMRIVILIACLCTLAHPQAGEKWLYSEYAETDALAGVYAGVESSTQPIPPDAEGLLVYFSVVMDCVPYYQVLTREKADAFWLRVDDGEPYRFRWFDTADDGVVAATVAPGDEENKQALEGRVNEAYLIARTLMNGNAVEVILQPSGEVLRWNLEDSREMIMKAYKHCAVDTQDRVFP